MSLKCGIVGLPNVGKSTLFNALTKAGIAAENYPFCTIEPNVGVVEMPDLRLGQLAAIVKPERVVPAIVEFVDIAGLVAGASTGEGLGNKFLAHIRETDATINVVRCFEDDNVIHVAGKVDPISDIEVIQTELCLADLSSVEKALHRVTKTARSGDKESIKLVALLEKCQAALNEARPVRTLDFSKEELPLLKQFFLITAKPAMFVANVAEDGFENNPFLDRLRAYADAQKSPVVAICAKMEAEMADMSDEDRQMFLEELGQSEPGLNRLIRAAYKLLGLQTYFTAGGLRAGVTDMDGPGAHFLHAGRKVGLQTQQFEGGADQAVQARLGLAEFFEEHLAVFVAHLGHFGFHLRGYRHHRRVLCGSESLQTIQVRVVLKPVFGDVSDKHGWFSGN